MSDPVPEREVHAGRIPDEEGASDRVAGSGDLGEIGLEMPDADVVEQYTTAHESHNSARIGWLRPSFDLHEVDAADAADQDRMVELDEDDYR